MLGLALNRADTIPSGSGGTAESSHPAQAGFLPGTKDEPPRADSRTSAPVSIPRNRCASYEVLKSRVVKTLRIEDYALIGDLETAALVGRNGSIDWLCWPEFSSPACFAALLGGSENGRWLIAPKASRTNVARRYRPHTLILETQFETSSGVVELIDLMPVRKNNSQIIRIVRGREGRVPMRMELLPRFDYGRTIPWLERGENEAWVASAGPSLAILSTSKRFGKKRMAF